MKKLIIIMAVASVVTAASAETFDGTYVHGQWKHFFTADADQTEINVTAGIAFDPTSQVGNIYDRVYLVNRSGANAKRGLYSIDVINETSSSRLAMGSDGSNNVDSPSGLAVDSSGNAYVSVGNAPSVWGIVDPSGVATHTEMLANYDAPGDDDPGEVSMVPTGFGGGYTADSDLLIFDVGLNNNDTNAVTVVNSGSTVGSPSYTTIWQEYNTTGFRGAVSDTDGKVYMAHYTLDLDDLGGTTNAYVLRLDSAGNTERIFLDIDPADVAKLDDSLTINPDDGSLWMAIEDTDATRDIFRIDLANAVATNGDYLAMTTLVIEDSACDNVGVSAMAISPDGRLLALGNPGGATTGQDAMYLYVIPEPATIGLFGFLGLALLWIRRFRN